jgi:hypothetical protein
VAKLRYSVGGNLKNFQFWLKIPYFQAEYAKKFRPPVYFWGRVGNFAPVLGVTPPPTSPMVIVGNPFYFSAQFFHLYQFTWNFSEESADEKAACELKNAESKAADLVKRDALLLRCNFRLNYSHDIIMFSCRRKGRWQGICCKYVTFYLLLIINYLNSCRRNSRGQDSRGQYVVV